MIALEDHTDQVDTDQVEQVESLTTLNPIELGKELYSLSDLEGLIVSLLAYLITGPKTVTQIARYIDKSDSATSQRLSKLRLKGYIIARGESTKRYYSINRAKINELLTSINSVLGSQG